MDKAGAMAMIELWEKPRILYKPKQDFKVILNYG